ncbi:hypothetical protein ISCGN_026366 [Ixodes scapularis]
MARARPAAAQPSPFRPAADAATCGEWKIIPCILLDAWGSLSGAKPPLLAAKGRRHGPHGENRFFPRTARARTGPMARARPAAAQPSPFRPAADAATCGEWKIIPWILLDAWGIPSSARASSSEEDEKEEDEVGACEERERGFGRLTKDGADATRPDLRRRDQTSRGPTHNPLLTQSGRQPSGGRQDCMRGAVEHPLPLRATDVLSLTQAFGQRPTASSLRPSAPTLADTWS